MAAARSAVTGAGGTVTSEDSALAILTASASASDFAAKADASSAVFGVAANRRIGSAPKREHVMDEVRAAKGAKKPSHKPSRRPNRWRTCSGTWP